MGGGGSADDSPCRTSSHLVFRRLLHVRNGNCKYHLGEETFKLAQSYMDKLAKHGHEANKAALYGELCALLFAKSHYDEVRQKCDQKTFLILPVFIKKNSCFFSFSYSFS